jgi:hypothetical protein
MNTPIFAHERRPTPEDMTLGRVLAWENNTGWVPEYAHNLEDRDLWIPMPPPPSEDAIALFDKLEQEFDSSGGYD